MSDDAVIWRYMDVHKFLYLLTTSQLTLVRHTLLGDDWEGALDESTIAARRRKVARKFELPPFRSDMPWENERALEHLRKLDQESQRFLNRFYLSCWHLSSRERMTMWKLYGGSVAIRSTVGRLRRALDRFNRTRYYLAKVDYKRRCRNEQSVLRLFTKRAAFEDERELRVAIDNGDKREPRFWGPGVFNVKIPTRSLIERVVISPTLPPFAQGALYIGLLSVINSFHGGTGDSNEEDISIVTSELSAHPSK